ncbi:hypothetical protein Tsubulata_044524 [Turnera subulata]|uniref:Uncharacterized protein n=1 Tax=Turnera subulata TaxID=218843 RepID=A0A9Q0FK31_9ROSI|nr:hypothetical protein Tsubulata_044524 [Turnera subulata]
MEVSGGVSAQFQPCSISSSRKPWRPLQQQLHRRHGRVKVKAKEKPSFSDQSHFQYYSSTTTTSASVPSTKKALKLLKSLSNAHFPLLSPNNNNINNSISDAARVLMNNLEQQRAEEKELKKQEKKKMKKAEKAKMKGSSRMKTMQQDCDSSSSSSSSSESDCDDQLLDMSCLRRNQATTVAAAVAQTLLPPDQLQQLTPIPFPPRLQEQNPSLPVPVAASGSGITSLTAAPAGKRIEVCMGGKCKKFGGEALLQEFNKVVGGAEAGAGVAVVGCKCMGKCRDGPNVRLCNNSLANAGLHGDPASTPLPPKSNPLCIGVALEDVGAIVSNFFAQDATHSGLTSPAP